MQCRSVGCEEVDPHRFSLSDYCLAAHMMPMVLWVLLVQGMVCTMSVGLLTTGVMVTMVMMPMLTVHVFVAVVSFTVMHVLRCRRTSWSRRSRVTLRHCYETFLLICRIQAMRKG